MTVHDYIWALYESERAGRAAFRTLDFGCGSGLLIGRAVRAGYDDFFGADTYYGDADRMSDDMGTLSSEVQQRICVLPPGQARLPFDDDSFDFVCSNQVFEHIADVPAVIAELARITRPGGSHFHAFGTKESWPEGHLHVPFIHKLPRSARKAWARPFYARGRVNHFQPDMPFDVWWDDHMGPFLNEATFYYSRRYFDREFGRHFAVEHVEGKKVAWHLRQRSPSAALRAAAGVLDGLPTPVATALEARRGNVAMVLRRP